MTDLVYPAPSLVVGLGRFGLAVLERLGEDWQQLRLSGGDKSLANLRLLWIHPESEDENCWRQHERRQIKIAHYIGDGDMPSITLDFVLLRTLGLIRYRHGIYQVAIPRDSGALRASDLLPDSGNEENKKNGNDDKRLVRRRFFEWHDLAHDPLDAAEKLRRVAERRATLHLFITPLINRIRQGHSPWILMAAILRCRSLAEGRDPSPWRWVRAAMQGADGQPSTGTIPKEQIQKARTGLEEHDDLLDRIAPSPLKPKGETQEGEEGKSKELAWKFVEEEIVVPTTFQPQETDPEAPIDPFHLLRENWETTGWATDLEERQQLDLKPFQVSHFRLGLFDHSRQRKEEESDFAECLSARLKSMAKHLHRGLVRLWVDLNREQVEERSPLPSQQRHEKLDEALEQSLQLLHELTVRPLESDADLEKETENLVGELHCPEDLPERPTRSLLSLNLDPDPRWLEESALERRLRALGLADPTQGGPVVRSLLQDICLPEPNVERHSSGHSTRNDESSEEDSLFVNGEPIRAGWSPSSSPELRKVLNREVRALLDFSYLADYRKKPTRTPPRLTVFVVGDMNDPFTRLKTTDVLRDVHSELLRSFSSMFELNREGFDRALSVVPILWMPHPSDPFGGEPLDKTRLEEAVIIDAVHNVRRWVESVLPSARRRISQIFISGRVTDSAVLTLRDSIEQTRDFLAFQIRNDLSQDDLLRRTAVGPGGDDFFACFACREIEFPAKRAREYLANRLARDCLHGLRADVQGRTPERAGVPPPPATEDLIGEASTRLQKKAEERGRELAEMVWNALPRDRRLHRCTTRKEILQRFDQRFENKLWGTISRLWQELVQRRGRMDELVDRARQNTSQELRTDLPKIRRDSDDDIEQTSTRGLPAVLSRLEERRREAFDTLQNTEDERQQGEILCQEHRVPQRRELGQALAVVTAAADAKPDCGPQRLGLLAWLLQTPATSSLLTVLLAPTLGPVAAPIICGLTLTAAAGAILWSHTRSGFQRLRRAIDQLADSARRLVAGDEDRELEKQAPSLRSFFEMRLRLTSVLARRGYAGDVFQQAALDEKLGQRLRESLDIQEHRMVRRAEALGVRPAPPGADEKDDLRGLFSHRTGGRAAKLIDPEDLVRFYRSRIRPDDLPVIGLLRAAGGLQGWRKSACLSDEDAVMGFGRGFFGVVAAQPITELDYFSEAVGESLREFANRHYSNLGFGAKFTGYEGLDPDGVQLMAEAALVADRPLLDAYKHAEERARAEKRIESRPRTLDRVVYKVRSNAAYMLSLVQGVRAHSVRNLKRFESFHDRPDDRSDEPPPLHLLTGHEKCGAELLRQVRGQTVEPKGSRNNGSEDESPAVTIGEEHDGLA